MSLGKFDYSIDSVSLESSTGETLEIKDIVISLDVYESLFTPYIKAELAVVDAANFLETAPILGQEKVTIKLTEGGKKLTKVFYVGSISNYIRGNNQAAMYNIKLITPEQMMNSLTLVSQAYTGKVSKAIDDIVRDYLRGKIKTVEESVGNYKVIVPNWNPFQAIDWLTRKAMDSKQTPFAFYETFNDGFILESYTAMMAKPTYNKFVHKGGTDTKNDSEQLQASFNVAIEYNLEEFSNTYKNTLRGAFGSAMHTVDIGTRTYKLLKYDCLEDFEKKPHLGKQPFINDKFKVQDKSINKYDSVHHIAFKNSKAFAENPANNYSNEAEFTKLATDPYIYQLSMTKVNMTVRGRIDLTPGKIIEFEVDRDRPAIRGNTKDSNEYISGRYLVLNVHHKMLDGKYSIIMDCVRDSIDKKAKAR